MGSNLIVKELKKIRKCLMNFFFPVEVGRDYISTCFDYSTLLINFLLFSN